MCALHAVVLSEMIHKVDLTGDYETNVYDAARRLLAATPSKSIAAANCPCPTSLARRRSGRQDVSSMKLRRWKAPLCRETALPAAPPDDVEAKHPPARNQRRHGPRTRID
jgi:hypothetical protein